MEEEKEKERCKKVSFINEDFALQYIKKLKETSVRTKVPSRAYLCEVCLNWHLTSKGEYSTTEEKEKQTKAKTRFDNQIRDRDFKIASLEKKLANAYDKITDLTRSNNELRKNANKSNSGA
jgi:predicted RNase H-like nuclease (RuvC/YqgF family)